MNQQKEENNSIFFSYEGSIGRKNYIINLLILFFLYIGLTLIRVDVLTSKTNIKIIGIILWFLVEMLKFIAIMSSYTLVYRRIKDICINRSIKFCSIIKKIYIIVYIIPLFIYFCAPIILDIYPNILNTVNLVLLFIITPITIISSIILGVIKRGNQ
jgi:uncharacterized membrane protein YhaH (DUF805 family)